MDLIFNFPDHQRAVMAQNDDSEMDLLVPLPDPATPKPPPPPARILNKELNFGGNVKNEAQFQNIVTHFFEITYLPDKPGEKPRKGECRSMNSVILISCYSYSLLELVKKNLIIKTKPRPPQQPQSFTLRTNLILNHPKRIVAPLASSAAYRVRNRRDRLKAFETPEESEARRKKERERKRISRLRIKQRKLALQSIESADSDRTAPTPPIKDEDDEITLQENSADPIVEEASITIDDFSKFRAENRKMMNRERQRRFRDRQRQGSDIFDGSSDSFADGKNSNDEEHFLECMEMIPENL